MKVAERIARFLQDKGCTHAFGFVGGANSILFSEISKRLELICTGHEQAAAMAAVYYYRTCGRIAPVVVTAGAGALNAMTGVMSGHVDGVPLLVISGNEKSMYLRGPQTRAVGFQGFNPEDVVRRFTKAVISVDNPLGAVLALEGLYKTALEHRQGACWLDIAQDIAAMELA